MQNKQTGFLYIAEKDRLFLNSKSLECVVNLLLLRRLEAYGFKSFADKTEVDFGPGITVVVGPNGSGKSNISDAIRWVLGEQNIRNLRGARVEDIIFSGSTGRRALGVAEVSLVFDNTDGVLPLDFNEVTITRRVFRSGESEYFINKAHCRLKDIHDLLADTGLGREAMPVISQNKVDEILNSKPEERRLIFEEAAGITRYKNRKKEALRKLDDTEQNLVRLEDIIAEIELQLEPLEASAARTSHYKELQEELTACRITLLVDKLKKAEQMVESATLQEFALKEEELTVSNQVLLGEAELERLTAQLAELEENLRRTGESLQQAYRETERLEGRIALLTEKTSQGSAAGERIAAEEQQNREQAETLQERLTESARQLSEKREQVLVLQQDLTKSQAAYQQTAADIQAAEARLELCKEQSFDYLQELVSARNEIGTLEKDMAKLLTNQGEYARELAGYGEQLTQTGKAVETALTEKTGLAERLAELLKEEQRLAEVKQALEADCRDLQNKEKALQVKLNEFASKHKILSHMQQDFDGFGRSSKSVLQNRAAWRQGICGAVAQLIQVPDPYVTAVETALGGALQYLVTEDETTAKQAIAFLKDQRLGRTTFLPLTTIQTGTPRDYELKAAAASGSLGLASAVVGCEQKYRKVVEFLLGRTIVAENIDAALAIAENHQYRVRIVTLDGQQVNPGGSLTGGSTHRRENSFLSRSNEIAALEKNIGETKSSLEQAQQAVSAAERKELELDKTAEAKQAEKQALEVRLAQLEVHGTNLQGELRRLQMAVDSLQEEMDSFTGEKTAMQTKLAQRQEAVLVLENRDAEHKQEMLRWQQELKLLNEQKDLTGHAVTDCRVSLTALEQQMQAAESESQMLRTELAKTDAVLQRLANEAETLREQTAGYDAELKEVKELHRTTEGQTADCLATKKELESGKYAALTELTKLEKEIKDKRRRHNEIQNRLHEFELMATKYKYELETCRKELTERCNVSWEEAVSRCREGSVAELTVQAKRLEEEIALLGPVNHSAIEEFARVRERYEFLRNQSEDLKNAREYLATIIQDIDKKMSKQFSVAFKEINQHFSGIFERLFGGGKAWLSLLEPDKPLETGVEVWVQPPGKKQQSLVLLSGGERALTVIALLFAFLTYRPAPFTMVDEIDAPLDEANLQRFSGFLRDYAQSTQFIVVTHRKGTMEVADIIHGVTMEESGVSRLVSVKLVDAAG